MRFKLLFIITLIFQCELFAGYPWREESPAASVDERGPAPEPEATVRDTPAVTGNATSAATSTAQETEAAAAEASLETAHATVGSAAYALTPAISPMPPSLAKQKLAASITTLDTELTACKTAVQYSKICIAGSNPGLLTAAGAVGLLLSAASQMKTMSDSCSKMNNALEIAKNALSVYNGVCSAAQEYCSTKCAGVMAKMKTVSGAATAAREDGAAAALNAGTAQTEPAVKLCESYKLNALAATAGILQMVTKSKRMADCKNALTVANCVTDPANPQCPQALDCSNPKNAQNTNCICMINPNSPGCPGALVSNSNLAPGGTGARVANLGVGKIDPGSYNASGGLDSDFISPSGGSAPGGASSAAGGMGFPGGGAGGGGVGTGAAKEAKGDQKKSTLNTNILGGFEGGGGGGGSRGGGSSGAGNSALKAYMPGGAKDPNRNLASQTFGNGEVTASGSKSNWEKVRDRYLENKPSLMGP